MRKAPSYRSTPRVFRRRVKTDWHGNWYGESGVLSGTDAHSAAFRPNNLLDMLGRLSQDIDYDYLDAMVHRNPDAVLQDKDLYTFYTIK
jgi:hypothetical protein